MNKAIACSKQHQASLFTEEEKKKTYFTAIQVNQEGILRRFIKSPPNSVSGIKRVIPIPMAVWEDLQAQEKM